MAARELLDMMASAISDRACGVIGGNDRSYSVNGNGGSTGVIGGGTGGGIVGVIGGSTGGHPFEPFYPFSQTRSGILASTPRGISPETHAPSEIRSPPPGFENIVPETSQSHSIRIKNIPSSMTRRDICNILLFAKDIQDVRMISEGAVAVFGSYESAVQAQQCLHGKAVDSFGGTSVLSVQLVDKDRELMDLGPLSPGSSPTSEGLGGGYTTSHPLFSRTVGVGAIGSNGGTGHMNGNNGGSNGVIGGGNANNGTVGGTSQNIIGSGVGSIGGGVGDNSFYEQQSFLQQLPPYHRQGADCDDADERGAAMGPRNRSLTNPLAINGPSRMPHLPQLSTAGTGFMNTPHHITSPINNNLVSPTPWLSNSSHPHPRNLPAANPADQNPPCNTLYVGNLPVNTTEDELKSLFSRQRGYKRLMLKPKPQGPMCFVEFEDIDFATKALADLYGRSLSNSVKGGIRLSFSKNPLGVRSSGNIHAPTPIGTSLLAGGSGTTGGSQFPFTTAVHNPPGLPAPANRQMSPGVYDQGQPGQGFGITPFGVPGGYYSHGR